MSVIRLSMPFWAHGIILPSLLTSALLRFRARRRSATSRPVLPRLSEEWLTEYAIESAKRDGGD